MKIAMQGAPQERSTEWRKTIDDAVTAEMWVAAAKADAVAFELLLARFVGCAVTETPVIMLRGDLTMGAVSRQ